MTHGYQIVVLEVNSLIGRWKKMDNKAVWSTKRGAFSISKVGLSVMYEHKTLPEVIVKEDQKLMAIYTLVY